MILSKNFSKSFAAILAVGMCVAGAIFIFSRFSEAQSTKSDAVTILNKPSSAIRTLLPAHVALRVPFTSQAPYANWSDPRQEDGCEEAVSTIAAAWVNNTPLSKAIALKGILGASAWEQKNIGNFPSLSVADTVRLAKGYFGIKNISLQQNVSVDDIKAALANGHIVIVPTNGRLLYNPHYTAPGPREHMVVITGYDDATGRFTTNDPGTRYGDGYTYSYQTLYDAIRAYPTGSDNTAIPAVQKSAIIVSKP